MIAYLHEKLLTQALYLIKELGYAMIQGYEEFLSWNFKTWLTPVL